MYAEVDEINEFIGEIQQHQVIRSQDGEVRFVEVMIFIFSTKMDVLKAGGLYVFHDNNVVVVAYTRNRGV